ncbi:MAG: hypothetical protein AAF404_08770 [Pseudomonadota bacterium]
MSKAKVIAALIAVSNMSQASDENPDLEFLEWLGQVAEVEEMGVDIDRLIEAGNEAAEEDQQEQSQ